MIKITNGQAHHLLNHPVAQKLFTDENRYFPIIDALRIADIVEQIKIRHPAYLAAMRKIIQRHNGTAHENGSISYESLDDQRAAGTELIAINNAEIELNGDKLKINGDWPKLTLAEASILNPIIEK